ncbi:MAG: hypothetical protein U0470_06725 [Anaerolineae bacterium]
MAALEAQAAARPADPAPLDGLLRVHLAATTDIAVARRAALALAGRPPPCRMPPRGSFRPSSWR